MAFDPGNPSYYAAPRIDFSPIADIGNSIAGAIGDYRERKQIADAFSKSGGDYNKMVQNLFANGHTDTAMKVAKIATVLNPAPDWRASGTGGIYDANARGVPNIVYPGSGGAGGAGGGPANPYYTPGSTADQSKAQSFFKQAELANKDIESLGKGVGNEGAVSQFARGVARGAGEGLTGSVASSFVEVDAAKLENAARRWVNAINYRDSGANVTKYELQDAFDNYIPRKGDPAEVIAQKSEARKAKEEGLAAGTGPNFPAKIETPPSGPNPAVDPAQLTKWALEAIKQGADPKAVQQKYQQLLGGAGGQ